MDLIVSLIVFVIVAVICYVILKFALTRGQVAPDIQNIVYLVFLLLVVLAFFYEIGLPFYHARALPSRYNP